jgi:hypothetical protein
MSIGCRSSEGISVILDDLRDRHPGETVWVIGSGPSLSFTDPEFFDDKLTVSINYSAKLHGFVPTYLFSHYHKVILDALHPDSVGVTLERDTLTHQPFRDRPDNVCVYPHAYDSALGTTWDPFKQSPLPGSLVYGSSSLHGGMNLAAFLGAKFLMLVGADCGTIDGAHRIEGYPAGHNPWSLYNRHNSRMKEWLVQEYGVAVYSLNPFINLNLEGHKFEGV